MGETATRLRLVFDAIAVQRGVYFSMSSTRSVRNVRSRTISVRSDGCSTRFFNSFRNDGGPSLMIAATNHPKAVYRRFEVVFTYGVPNPEMGAGDLPARQRCHLGSPVD
ncbi:hypothetical protein [Bradyrhizobium neotropicale]|uniref:hypothetical protein n=1 Tax=Bradyrhizobium neotropicale TaxID=1497615 RepID=UPI00390807D0